MTLVGLAKNQEELFFAGDQESIRLPWNSESLKLIRRIRDEVHRFGIGFHRSQRSRTALKNELDEIPGIGQATRDQLLRTNRSMSRIRSLTIEELEKQIGKARARLVFEGLQAKKEKGPG